MKEAAEAGVKMKPWREPTEKAPPILLAREAMLLLLLLLMKMQRQQIDSRWMETDRKERREHNY